MRLIKVGMGVVLCFFFMNYALAEMENKKFTREEVNNPAASCGALKTKT